MTDTEHSTTSSLTEEDAQFVKLEFHYSTSLLYTAQYLLVVSLISFATRPNIAMKKERKVLC